MTPDFDECAPNLWGDDFSIPANPELVADGWERRFLADEARAKEAFDLYTSLGYEVKSQKLTPNDFGPLCGDCQSAACQLYVMIYTRKTNSNKTNPNKTNSKKIKSKKE